MKHLSGKLIFLAAMSASNFAHAAAIAAPAANATASQVTNSANTNPTTVTPTKPITQATAPGEDAGTTTPAPRTDYKGMACPALPFLMDGSYIGIQTGYNSFRSRNVITEGLPGIITATSNTVHATNGWALGALLGYGKTFRHFLYLGGEIYINANTYDEPYFINTGGLVATTEISAGPTVGISLLPGIKFTDTTLTYVRLGWNRGALKTSQSIGALDSVNHTNYSSGFVFGVGLETLITTNYSLRGEFDHMYFSSYSTQGPFIGDRVTPSSNQYMLSLIYHFG